MSDRNSLSGKSGALSSPRQLCLFLGLISSVRLQNHSETKLVYRDLLSACDVLVTDIPHFRNYKRNRYKLSAQRFLGSFGWPIVSYDWLIVVSNTIDQLDQSCITNACQPKRFTILLELLEWGIEVVCTFIESSLCTVLTIFFRNLFFNIYIF